MSWLQTRSGVAFDLLSPEPEMVRLEDIAFALARLCRFTGHVPLYTVAQHSVHISEHLYGPDAVVGLLHVLLPLTKDEQRRALNYVIDRLGLGPRGEC